MNALALIRHGDLDGNNLSHLGQRQAASLGRQLRDSGGRRQLEARVLSSPAPRARQTASALCSFLGLREPEEDPRLWSGPDGPPGSWEQDLPGLVRKLDEWSRGTELLVVVTHFELCLGLPPLLARKHGLDGVLPRGLRRGQGLWVEGDGGLWRLLDP
ncbi:MAG: phosphoglycerate mutase family protein [Candidatus Delongbacteria bacterium]